MALTAFQRDVCRRLGQNRIAAGEAYLAGGVTLNELIAAPPGFREMSTFSTIPKRQWQPRGMWTGACWRRAGFPSRCFGNALRYLMWAACGKDPGFSPAAILEHAGRSARYTAEEVLELSFDDDPPDPGELSKRWHHLLESAAKVIELLPAEETGKCVLTRKDALYREGVSQLLEARLRDEIVFHAGCLRGAFPRVLDDR